MGQYIFKPLKDDDFYVVYSTIVDSPVDYGSKERMLSRGITEDRINRADEKGSSSHIGEGRWEDKTFHVREGIIDPTKPENAYWAEVQRKDAREFCESLQQDGYFHPPAGLLKWEVLQ